MRWSDEQYVRVYTRDTTNWLLLSWEARAVMVFLLRKVDRSGHLPVDRELRGLAKLLDVPHEILVRAMAELERTRPEPTIIVHDHGGGMATIVIPNFVAAQSARKPSSATERQQAHRERMRASKSAGPQMALPISEPASVRSETSIATSSPPTSSPGDDVGGERPRHAPCDSRDMSRGSVTCHERHPCAVLCSTKPELGGVGGHEAPPATAPPPSGRELTDESGDPEPDIVDDPHEAPALATGEAEDALVDPHEGADGHEGKPTRLPVAWQPLDEDIATLRAELGVDPLPAVGKFRDFWHAAHGRRAERLDWDATFRAFIRKERGLPAWPPPKPRLVRAPPAPRIEDHPTAGLAPAERVEKAKSMLADLERAIETRAVDARAGPRST